MATFSKPASVPRWADTNGLIIEPPEAKKDAGWGFTEVPPSNFENWKENLNGNWWKWINERFRDGATNDELEIIDPVSTLAMASIVDGRVTAGRSATDGINLFGIGALKGITFDSNLNQLRYDIGTDSFRFFCNSASPSMNIEDDRIQAFQPVVIGAGAPHDVGDLVVQNGLAVGAATNPGAGQGIFGAHIRTGSDAAPNANWSILGQTLVGINDDSPNALTPLACTGIMVGNSTFRLLRTVSEEEYQLHFEDVDNMVEYDNVDLQMRFHVGGASRFRIEANGVTAARFIPTAVGGQVVSPFELTETNAICFSAKCNSAGTLLGRSWNVDTVNVAGIGDYELTADIPIQDDVAAIACIQNANSSFLATASYNNTANRFEVATFSRATGTLTSIAFAVIGVGG